MPADGKEQLYLCFETASSWVGALRLVAARINYLAQERAELQFARKDLCRHLASPEVHYWEKAKRIARYLKGKPRAIQHFAFGKIAPQLDGFTGWRTSEYEVTLVVS